MIFKIGLFRAGSMLECENAWMREWRPKL